MIIDVARVCIELDSPMAIGTGESLELLDAPIIRDANGLPTIPGSSLAGVLRAAWSDWFGADSAGGLFGRRAGASESRVAVSFGHIHDSSDHPTPLRASSARLEDSLLALARTPIAREHVRITHRGAAAHRGLFDEVVVPAGHRFTFELTVRDDTEAIIEGLVGLLASPAVRLGGKTRRGLGAFRVIRANRRRFDLTKRGDHEALGALDPDLSTPPAQFSRLTPKPPRPTGGRAPLVATMKLKPRGLWLIGGGDGETDHAPYTEPRVVWEGGAARWEAARLAVPATALKGALRHRAAFRWNLAHEKYADQLADPAEVAAHGGTDNPGLIALFGDVGSGSERARAGRLYVEDATVSGNWREGRQDHVSLDRFTGGAFPGRLFDETLVHGGELSSQLVIRPPVDPSDQFRDAVAALNSALSDLSRRGIQLGAGHGRGHGWMETTVDRDAAWTAFLEEST